MRFSSFVSGAWADGEGVETTLRDPSSGEVLGEISSRGLDLAAALEHARTVGGPALRQLSYAQRAELLRRVADRLSERRDHYYEIARRNSGNTREDAAIDIDGAIATLKVYARLGAGLGEARILADKSLIRLAKSEAFQGAHVMAPRQGCAVHINAFNFPGWGLWEKAAVSLLSGVPAVVKPASSTAWLAQAMVQDVAEADILPEGALSLVCGGVGTLFEGLRPGDLIAFTGSAETGSAVRTHPAVVRHGVSVNVEADSLNAAVLGPDVEPGSPLFEAFVREVAREMRIKAGQKCTAIRRIFAPARTAGAVSEAIVAALAAIVVGDPRDAAVTMGPLVTASQRDGVLDGLKALSAECDVLHGGGAPAALAGGEGNFVAPTLLRARDASGASAAHEIEVFGPAATVFRYGDLAELFELVRRGGGSLVASCFTEDAGFMGGALAGLGSFHGRLMFVDGSVADAHTGHGIVMPTLNHGGPGRAGGGEELGGLNGLRFYHQRVALQGPAGFLRQTIEGAAALS